jgi:hypothetical protein
MLNYYDEIKNDILEVLEEDEGASDILHSESCRDAIIDKLTDYFTDCDSVTGNGSGSYYCNAYKARKHCYNYFRDVFESLEEYGYKEELVKFKIFKHLAEEGYIDIDTMRINDDAFCEEEYPIRYHILRILEEISDLDFEAIDVITRCYMLYSVVSDVVKNFLKYGLTK